MTPPWLDPRVWIALVVLLVIIGGVAAYEIRLASVRSDLEQAVKAKETAEAKDAARRVQVVECENNRDQLAATITAQNQRIEQLRADATAAETAANVRALRALEAGRAAARAVDAGVGPTELNTWLSAEFAP